MIYVASRVKHAAMWQQFRNDWPINSTWIDEAGEGESASIIGLWSKIVAEIRAADSLVLFATADDFPLKGALIEAGIAIGLSKPVFVCLPGVILEPRSDRPIGSWIRHPLVRLVSAPLHEAMRIACL